MMRSKSWIPLATAAAFAALCQPSLLACVACFGQSDSTMAKGMNVGIFVLLFVITSVLCGVAGFFVYLARRGAQIEEEHHALVQSFSEHRTNA